jgi:hypothetical protein
MQISEVGLNVKLLQVRAAKWRACVLETFYTMFWMQDNTENSRRLCMLLAGFEPTSTGIK